MNLIFYTSLFAALPAAKAAATRDAAQQILTSPASHKVKVPGHNSAYYTQIDASEQLFSVRELAVYPNPPKLNEHIFLYLGGRIADHLPDLARATIKISGVCPDYWEEPAIEITDAHRIAVRHEYVYGGPLTSLENNELLLDRFVSWWSPREEKWNCSVEATARLPDERILFSFAQNFTLEYSPNSDDRSD